MLDLPDVVEGGPVGELDLLERVGQPGVLRCRSPGPGQLVLVEDAEPHVVLPDPSAAAARVVRPGLGRWSQRTDCHGRSRTAQPAAAADPPGTRAWPPSLPGRPPGPGRAWRVICVRWAAYSPGTSGSASR